MHAGSRRLGRTADLATVAKLTPGFTGADLANVINEAALLALRRSGSTIEAQDLDEAVQRVMAGPKRRGHLLSAAERHRVAYHEAGHVVVATAVDFPAEIGRVSIVARGRNAAHADLLPRSDREILTRRELLAEMTIALGGLAAELLHTGEDSTAGEADLERATEMARRFAGRYGMSSAVGRMRVMQKDTEVFLGRDYMAAQHISSETLKVVDQAVRELIEEAEARARCILEERKPVVVALADALLEQESLSAEEVGVILAEGEAASEPPASPATAVR